MKRDSDRPIDSFDRKILAILQRDNLTPQREISQRINLSPAAVHRRIRRLHNDKVIVADVAQVDPAALGRPLLIIVEVAVESERLTELATLERTFASAPEVQQCYYVTGECDFVLVLTARDMAEYEAFTRVFFASDNVKRFRTLVAMKVPKAGLSVPI